MNDTCRFCADDFMKCYGPDVRVTLERQVPYKQ